MTFREWLWLLLTRDGWRFMLKTERFDQPHDDYRFWRLRRLICRLKGHPPGVYFYNPGGMEPDMHCMGCGDNLG